MPTTSPLRLLAAWAALSLLAGLSLLLRWAPLGAWALPVALGIAACKAVVVFYAFMHVAREAPSVRLLALLTVSTVLVLCLGVFGDVALR